MGKRKRIPVGTKTTILTEAGYRCGNPVCRNVLALDFHHIIEVKEGGGNDPSNLLPLCGLCHDLYHRGTIMPESIRAWKVLLVSLSNAFDRKAIDILLMLSSKSGGIGVWVSGDGLLECASLIASGLVTTGDSIVNRMPTNFGSMYELKLTEKGRLVVQGWKEGDLSVLENTDVLNKPCRS